MAAEYGFVYVLANESMPGIYKIGFTLNHPRARMDQLSSATACPTPFTLLAAYGCENPRNVELEIHAELGHRRVNQLREFFKLDILELADYLMDTFSDIDDLTFTHAIDQISAAERYEAWEKFQQVKNQELVDLFLSQEADPFDPPKKRGFE
jgi:hypothetical protein